MHNSELLCISHPDRLHHCCRRFYLRLYPHCDMRVGLHRNGDVSHLSKLRIVVSFYGLHWALLHVSDANWLLDCCRRDDVGLDSHSYLCYWLHRHGIIDHVRGGLDLDSVDRLYNRRLRQSCRIHWLYSWQRQHDLRLDILHDMRVGLHRNGDVSHLSKHGLMDHFLRL